jgi:DNA-binding CsgD family transcriptional regulator
MAMARKQKPKLRHGEPVMASYPGGDHADLTSRSSTRYKVYADPDPGKVPWQPTKPAAPKEPLTDRQKAALDYIRKNQPVTAKQIATGIGTSVPSVTNHIIPALRPHGVKNKRGAGYYVN